MTTHNTAIIRYLDSVCADGTPHGGWTDRRPKVSVPPTLVALTRPLPVEVHVGWGDREVSPDLPVWTSPDSDGISMSMGAERAWSSARVEIWRHVGSDRYPHDTIPEWSPAFLSAVTEIREAAAIAERDRPDVQVVCAGYRRILRQIDEEHARHYAQWERDVAAIARRFRRSSVQVGEQTVPGLCVVRSTRGRTLGYAVVQDGRWTGQIKRA